MLIPHGNTTKMVPTQSEHYHWHLFFFILSSFAHLFCYSVYFLSSFWRFWLININLFIFLSRCTYSYSFTSWEVVQELNCYRKYTCAFSFFVLFLKVTSCSFSAVLEPCIKYFAWHLFICKICCPWFKTFSW